MNKIDRWDGQAENAEVEYVLEETKDISLAAGTPENNCFEFSEKNDEADKYDYMIVASCGVLTGLLDAFWVGDFSLTDAQKWGGVKVNSFVIRVAQVRGYKKDNLEGAIRFLEKDAPMVSDKMTNVWGGGLQHHLRDFGHHVSIAGLVFSILTQLTGLSFGTNTEGRFEIHELSDKSLVGKTFEEKIYNGVVLWALHLVSDMAGSSEHAGKGTGIPGPILSLFKELSVLPGIRDLHVTFKEDNISLSAMLSKIFNGTAFDYTNNNDLLRFDLRTEMGIYAHGVTQSTPVIVNQCLTRAFYFVRRLCLEINDRKIHKISEIKQLDSNFYLPWNNKCIRRMETISSGVFCVVNMSDAAIRAFLSGAYSKGEFTTKLMLRTNFVGIGNFVISIKNDIAANILGDTKQRSKADEATEAVGVFDNIVIDVAVDIDSAGIYEYVFYRMFEHVKKTKEKFSAAMSGDRGMQRTILQLEDDDTSLFDTVAKASYHSLIVETEDLMMRLLTFYGIGYVPFKGDEKYSFYTPFYRIEGGKKVAYVFSERLTPYINFERIISECCVDRIKVIAMVERGDDSKTLNTILGYENKKAKCPVEYCVLQDVFSLISDTEYFTYKSYVEKYNNDIKKLIGYRTIVVPSESSLHTLKEKLEMELKETDFNSFLRAEGIHDNQIRIINNNFWNRELFKSLFGNTSFAESFISSEWYYQTHAASTALEQTAIVAGYLKSVEQLLFTLVQLSIDTGKSIKKKGTGKLEYIGYTTENIEAIDTSLGSIIGFVRHYTELWAVNGYVKNYVANKLNNYREKYRNDHFHKDNINSTEEIEEIRYNTILIHYLLLGAMKIDNHHKETLGIHKVKSDNDKERTVDYSSVENWLNRILGGDNLLPIDTNIYFRIVGFGTDQWQTEFTTVSGFSEIGRPENINCPYIEDELKWHRADQDMLAAEKQMLDMIRRYLNEGKYANNLKKYKTVSCELDDKYIVLYSR